MTNNNQPTTSTTPATSTTPVTPTTETTPKPIAKDMTGEWIRFMEIFPELTDPIQYFEEGDLQRIEKGATPMEAFLLRLVNRLFASQAKLNSAIRQSKEREQKQKIYPGSLQNQHPAPEVDPFLQGIRGI